MKTPVPGWAVPGSAHRAARPTNCETCGRYILRGLNRDKGGLVVDCDPEPLTPLGEALALMAGFHTYESQWFGGQHTISWRDRWAIASHKAGDGIDALIEHRCDRPELLEEYPRMRSVQSYQTVTFLPEDPPF